MKVEFRLSIRLENSAESGERSTLGSAYFVIFEIHRVAKRKRKKTTKNCVYSVLGIVAGSIFSR